ncbi:hypothetical protein CDLVIII_5537 [Clostridium sp. DL-VIII]|uniref:DUF445 family protein n=1 Tax=Clostridium sp. DL-VIII TaxID=641107 RepID=UPI00023B05E2|nr:DUF445 family protein [Clostridium sp. DL-VIII]EHJ02011.1 hypothetical protein CDLVIII_5537 [Clostridium sp. DL-VIII]
MLKFVLLILLQGISGGISGYITNKYAVNMLFKEYTPLKLGGVVKKKREKFIEEISELLERDIINSKTLKAEISNKNLDVYINQISEFFLEKGLNDNIGDMKVQEVFDFSNSDALSEGFIRKNLHEVLPEFLGNIFTKMNLEDLLNEEQISQIVTSTYDLLVNEVEKSSTLKELISDLYEENSNKKLSEIFSEELQEKLINNVSKNIIEIVNENILKDEQSCQIFFDKILEAINVNSTVIKLQERINDYTLNKFISDSEEKEITLNLYNKMNNLINSPKGRELILNFINELYLIGKDIDFTIYELLPAEMETSLTGFIKTVIPKIMPYISEWILNNKESFDEMIEEAIDEAIDGMDENIKKLVISKVRSALMGDISSENDIVNKIINYFNNSLDEDSYNKLTNTIINYLKNKKIKDIVKLLEKQDFISCEKAVDFIIKQCNLHGKNIIGAIVKSQLSKSIDKFIELDLVNLFNNKLKPTLYRSIFRNKDKLNAKVNTAISDFINIKGNELFNKNLLQLLPENKVSKLSNKFVSLAGNVLNRDSVIYKEKLKNFIVSKVKNINLVSTLEKYEVDISDFIVDNFMVSYKEIVDKNKKREVREVINTYFNKENLSDILINEGYPTLISKLPNLLDGNIKKFAKDNLNKYDEDEICDIVQEFMGNQLKPLSVFGGILGTVVGIAYQLIFPDSIGWYGFPGSLINLIMSLAIMAGIGYITNVIALWMIFHPYKENKIVSKIPFFKKFALGYIPAHKNQFAVGMAKLIDEELLNKEEINKSFNKHKDITTSALMALITNNNYQVLVNFVRNKKRDIGRYIYKGILKYCDNKPSLSKKIADKIKETKFDKFIKKNHVLSIMPKLIDSLNEAENYLVDLAQKKLSSDNHVNDILPREIFETKQYAEIQIEKILKEKINSAKETDLINTIISAYRNDYDLQIKKSCEDILGKASINKVNGNFEIKLYSYITNDLKIDAGNKIRQFLNDGLDENNDIGSMFIGKVKEVIDVNLEILADKITDRAILYLQSNKEQLAFTVQETIKDNLNFFEKIAYGAFGGDDIAYKVVEIILYKKLPIFIKSEGDNIINICRMVLDKNIYPMKVSELKIEADKINTVMLIDNIFEKFNKEAALRENINKFSTFVLEHVFSTPLIEYLKLCNLHSLDLVYEKFYNEFNIIKGDVYSSLSKNAEAVSKITGEFLEEKLIEPFFNISSLQAFDGITDENVKEVVHKVLNLISSSEVSKKHLAVFVEELYDSTISKIQIKQIVDFDILDRDIEKVVKTIFEDEEFNKTNINLIEKVVQNAIDDNLDFVTDDSKNYIIGQIIQIGLSSASEYIVPILQEINLKNISNKQIEALDPKEIDMLFNSFAGDFFSKLRLYGIFGFVFGINVGLSIILLGLDLRYSNVSSKKELTHYK